MLASRVMSKSTFAKNIAPKTLSRSPPKYKLLLHNDIKQDKDDDRYVVKVIGKVIEDMTVEEAWKKATEARAKGTSLLRVCHQDIAERYCEKIRANGVKSTIEPA